MSAPDLSTLPGLPRDAGGPVFAEPWQAQAFAMTVKLHEAGLFAWGEWAQALGAEFAAAAAAGHPDDGTHYYEHWLSALEKLVVDRGVADTAALAAMRDAWDRAAKATPHGQPIELAKGLK